MVDPNLVYIITTLVGIMALGVIGYFLYSFHKRYPNLDWGQILLQVFVRNRVTGVMVMILALTVFDGMWSASAAALHDAEVSYMVRLCSHIALQIVALLAANNVAPLIVEAMKETEEANKNKLPKTRAVVSWMAALWVAVVAIMFPIGNFIMVAVFTGELYYALNFMAMPAHCLANMSGTLLVALFIMWALYFLFVWEIFEGYKAKFQHISTMPVEKDKGKAGEIIDKNEEAKRTKDIAASDKVIGFLVSRVVNDKEKRSGFVERAIINFDKITDVKLAAELAAKLAKLREQYINFDKLSKDEKTSSKNVNLLASYDKQLYSLFSGSIKSGEGLGVTLPSKK